MSENKNPWRDIFTPNEWTLVRQRARPAMARAPGSSGFGRDGRSALELEDVTQRIRIYDMIPKDRYDRFRDRIDVLFTISRMCDEVCINAELTHFVRPKSTDRKTFNDDLVVWLRSLSARARKKAEYLATMETWHRSAKPRYRSREQLRAYLLSRRGAARNGGRLLQVMPNYAMETQDPYHRKMTLKLEGRGSLSGCGLMGQALVRYLEGIPSSDPNRATNNSASFFEWLEYHPMCVGTPVVTLTAKEYRSPRTVRYHGQRGVSFEIGEVLVGLGRLECVRPGSDPLPTRRCRFSTEAFSESSLKKGRPGSVAYVWAPSGRLYVHPHAGGQDGFHHPSISLGRAVRCAGMIAAEDGYVTYVSNRSGHYRPSEESLFYFLAWLDARKVLRSDARVELVREDGVHDRRMREFLGSCSAKYRDAERVPYPEQPHSLGPLAPWGANAGATSRA